MNKRMMGRLLALVLAVGCLGGCGGPGAGAVGSSPSSQSVNGGPVGMQHAGSAQGDGSAAAPAASVPAAAPAQLPLFHFSVDDVLDLFSDLNVNQDVYQTVFEQPMLGFLRRMYEEYGMVSTLYCFYENHNNTFNLAQVTDHFAAELAQNSHWLRFGFHARSINTRYDEIDARQAALDYDDCVQQLKRITGGAPSIDTVVRLHWFGGGAEAVAAMAAAETGITGLLCGVNTSDTNYYLDEAQQDALFARTRCGWRACCLPPPIYGWRISPTGRACCSAWRRAIYSTACRCWWPLPTSI